MINIPSSSIKSSCVACIFTNRKCPPYCREATIFWKVISPQDYHTIFTVFGPKSVASIFQCVPGDQYLQTPHLLFYEANARIKDPVGGCFARMASFEQRLEELQTWVVALEARLKGGSTSANPSSPPTPPESFLNLLMSVSLPKESSFEVLPTEVDPPEYGNLLIQTTLPIYSTLSDYQVALDVLQNCPSQSSQVGTSQVGIAVETIDLLSPDWVDLEHNFSNCSSFDLDVILNFNVDDLRILQYFLND